MRKYWYTLRAHYVLANVFVWSAPSLKILTYITVNTPPSWKAVTFKTLITTTVDTSWKCYTILAGMPKISNLTSANIRLVAKSPILRTTFRTVWITTIIFFILRVRKNVIFHIIIISTSYKRYKRYYIFGITLSFYFI